MELHFAEVFLLIAICMAAGSFLGTLLYSHLAETGMAAVQRSVAYRIDDWVTWPKRRLRRKAEMPSREEVETTESAPDREP